ncbi:NEDD4 family-interacting protein 2 [Maylandia zebra]|uniref:NEDD4 family-interacting protein 2 n=4 Tax=Pseudocrenilabrinae TaxID=318546 RepID=A0A3B4FK25_9CICH|nr:PREDICTED: NEDD4 family-interacting protein 2 [Pundamilia nyererei]XP_005945281.1 NEDD4 family-interacting protein 2 [Haplochromis burtoni]XP_006795756.1 NEDD4 family-interacting protein 2 [Neolamprologus brichardi]XP_026014392.1 NEDD4 family-interacting protein 2 [Astatotilapia calliptera]XP_039907365.1 NEDD4 family-interacting protein 2 [Simochromis diagramma]
MDPASRYQVLHNEDDSSEAGASEPQPCTSATAQPGTSGQDQSQTQVSPTPVPAAGEASGVRTQGEAVDTAPPPYASIDLGANAAAPPETSFRGDFPVPPPYSVATSLPTYDEAEKAKAAAMAASAVEVMPRDDDFPPRDDFSDADQLRVGNDGIFMLAFFMAFLFNWIGFCLSFCLTNTIAGRYGAICGFGLSLIKWILIVRFSDYFTGYFNGQYWLWWIFLLLGLLLFFRGFVNYLKVRNMSENMATSHRTRLFFLY